MTFASSLIVCKIVLQKLLMGQKPNFLIEKFINQVVQKIFLTVFIFRQKSLTLQGSLHNFFRDIEK